MTQNIERQIIELVAADRIDVPVSSMSGKLKRMKPKLAGAISLPDSYFEGERVYARVETNDGMKARGMRDGIEMFEGMYPRHGKILKGLIEEQRADREVNLYFGVNPGCRLTADDYLSVMANLGFNENTARSLYHELVEVSRNLSRKRQEERSILIG